MSYNLNNSIQGGNLTLTSAALTGLSGSATTHSLTSCTQLVDGKFVTTAGSTVTPVLDAITGKAFLPQAKNTACTYVFSSTGSTVVHVSQGPVVAWTDTTANSTPAPFPEGGCPTGDAPYAYVTIENGSTGSAWTIGTSNWNQTGIVTPAVINIGNIPAAVPLTA